jgi:hypothetical protein
MADNNSAGFESLVSRKQAEDDFRKAMNLYVGRGKQFSNEQLAKSSLVPVRLIECFRSYPLGHPDYRKLHFGHMLSIASVLGAEFSTEWLARIQQGAFDLPDAEPDPGMLAIETSEDNAKVVRMAVDHNFDNDSAQSLRCTGTSMMTHGAQLVAAAAHRQSP